MRGRRQSGGKEGREHTKQNIYPMRASQRTPLTGSFVSLKGGKERVTQGPIGCRWYVHLIKRAHAVRAKYVEYVNK